MKRRQVTQNQLTVDLPANRVTRGFGAKQTIPTRKEYLETGLVQKLPVGDDYSYLTIFML
jgi:hypothetical protein